MYSVSDLVKLLNKVGSLSEFKLGSARELRMDYVTARSFVTRWSRKKGNPKVDHILWEILWDYGFLLHMPPWFRDSIQG